MNCSDHPLVSVVLTKDIHTFSLHCYAEAIIMITLSNGKDKTLKPMFSETTALQMKRYLGPRHILVKGSFRFLQLAFNLP